MQTYKQLILTNSIIFSQIFRNIMLNWRYVKCTEILFTYTLFKCCRYSHADISTV